MKVVSFKVCPFVQRVTALLELKEEPYAIEYIDLSSKPQWFLNISPHRQVPILILDDGPVLFESDAIFEYIDEARPPPVRRVDPLPKAHDLAWLALAPVWVKCLEEDCSEFICTMHEKHVSECSCPPVESWAFSPHSH